MKFALTLRRRERKTSEESYELEKKERKRKKRKWEPYKKQSVQSSGACASGSWPVSINSLRSGVGGALTRNNSVESRRSVDIIRLKSAPLHHHCVSFIMHPLLYRACIPVRGCTCANIFTRVRDSIHAFRTRTYAHAQTERVHFALVARIRLCIIAHTFETRDCLPRHSH